MKYYCPHCGVDVSGQMETEYGIICPKCKWDFWESERLTDEDIKNGIKPMNELLNDLI